jgi:hypothetical protein
MWFPGLLLLMPIRKPRARLQIWPTYGEPLTFATGTFCLLERRLVFGGTQLSQATNRHGEPKSDKKGHEHLSTRI